jgi:hypothetical protein
MNLNLTWTVSLKVQQSTWLLAAEAQGEGGTVRQLGWMIAQ